MADDAKTISAPAGVNIYQRMHAVMQEIKYVQKEKKAGMRYSIVSHDSVTALVRPLFVKHGIVVCPRDFRMEQIGNRTQLQCTVFFQNIDDPRDFMGVDSAGYGIDDQDKGPGKAISYAVKYAYLKALCLESGDDPDEDQETISQPSISDPRRAQVEAFKLQVGAASTMEALDRLRIDIKPTLDSLASDFPAYVAEAQQRWKAKALPLSKKRAAANEEAPAET